MSEGPPRQGRGRAPWWLPGVLICAIGLGLSFVQPSCAMGRDIRLEAARSIAQAQRTRMGDPAPSIVAARRLAANPRARVYDGDPTASAAFVFPPIAARLYEPLASLPFRMAHQRLAVANHLLFWGIVLLLLRLMTKARDWGWADIGFVFGAAAVFYPLHHAVELNQSMVLVTFLIGVTMLALDAGREAFAGCVFALALALAPQLVLVLPLMSFHARRMVFSAVVMSLLLFALSLTYAGVDNHVDYATKVLPALSRGYAHYEIVAAVAAYGGAILLVRRWRATPGIQTWVFGFAWLTATVVSSMAHPYAPALFVFVLVARSLSGEPAMRQPRIVVAAAVAFALLAGYFEVRALHGSLQRLLASYLFFGALALGGALVLAIEARGGREPLRR